MGVLVGTSLIVIIPEGVETLYSANGDRHANTRKARDVAPSALDVRWREAQPVVERRSSQEVDAFGALPGPVIPEGLVLTTTSTYSIPTTPTQGVGIMAGSGKGTEAQEGGSESEEHQGDDSAHVWIGVSLISGFILMYLIDQVPRHASSSSKQPPQPYHISLDNLGLGFNRGASSTADRDPESETFLPAEPAPRESQSFATTTGLVIHAAADGIALGASSSGPSTGLSFIIFIAIMVHKAPAAFGLTSVLLKQGLTKREARGHLILFSLAAPAGALITYFLAQGLGGSGPGDAASTKWWTGILLLFSGGTFL